MNTPVLVMEMLTRLHQLGYQRLRLSTGMSPNGMSWRYSVAPIDQFEPDGYLLQRRHYPGTAFGSSRGQGPPFEWESSEGLDPDELARQFAAETPGQRGAEGMNMTTSLISPLVPCIMKLTEPPTELPSALRAAITLAVE